MQCEFGGCSNEATHVWRCDDHHRCDDCGTTENLCYRLSGLRCDGCHRVLMDSRIANFSGDTEYTTAVVCPWCGTEEYETTEYGDRDDGFCGECEREFLLERHIEITFSTKRSESKSTATT